MAYTNNEYRVQVRGSLANGTESFINTWTVLDVTTGQDVNELAAIFRDFYIAAAALEMSSWTTIIGARAKNLGTGLVTDLAPFVAVDGDDLADPMPTQIGVRVSLTGPAGLNGGPFIPGWSKNAGDEFGLFSHASQLATAAHDLCTDLVAAGWQLRIDRPTLSQTVAVLSGRVGKRFDVIRKRANDIVEGYTAFTVV